MNPGNRIGGPSWCGGCGRDVAQNEHREGCLEPERSRRETLLKRVEVTFLRDGASAVALMIDRQRAEAERLRAAIVAHHGQKADDRCIEDDDRLYAAAGLPPCDRRVGSKAAMLKNCRRFIEKRCQGGGWPSYVELEKRLKVAELKLLAYQERARRRVKR